MNFLSKLIPWYVSVAIVAGCIAAGAFGLYRWGYNNAEHEYVLLLEQQKAKVKELEGREKEVTKETVTVFKDKIKTVIQVQEKIVEVTKDVLGDEVNHCDIGGGFISLHNAAAAGKALSSSAN